MPLHKTRGLYFGERIQEGTLESIRQSKRAYQLTFLFWPTQKASFLTIRSQWPYYRGEQTKNVGCTNTKHL